MQLRRIVIGSVLLFLCFFGSAAAGPPVRGHWWPPTGQGELPDTFIVYAGSTDVGVGSDTFVVETERTIMLIIEELTTDYVEGRIRVLEDPSSHVSIYWVRYEVVIFDDLVVDWTDFDYFHTETGHAEKRDDQRRPTDDSP